MNNNQKLLVGLGIGVVLYYLYTRNKGQTQAAPQSESQSTGAVTPSLPNSQGQNVPKTLNSLAVNAPSTLPKNVTSSNKPMQSKDEQDCMFQYIRMPKPQVVASPEYWAKHQEEFVKKCIQRKNKLSSK